MKSIWLFLIRSLMTKQNKFWIIRIYKLNTETEFRSSTNLIVSIEHIRKKTLLRESLFVVAFNMAHWAGCGRQDPLKRVEFSQLCYRPFNEWPLCTTNFKESYLNLISLIMHARKLNISLSLEFSVVTSYILATDFNKYLYKSHCNCSTQEVFFAPPNSFPAISFQSSSTAVSRDTLNYSIRWPGLLGI